MEWHIFNTVAACFLAILGLLMDIQSLKLGFRQVKTGRRATSVILWPLLLYIAAALISDMAWIQKGIAMAGGAIIHLVCTLGIRALRSTP